MRSKKLNAYRGPLSAEEIAAGMNAANANALRLVEDAKVLLAVGRIPSAASLSALSIEESGKTSILRQLATATSKDEIASAWKSYRSHTRKNVQWQLPALALAGARRLEETTKTLIMPIGQKHLVTNFSQHLTLLSCGTLRRVTVAPQLGR